MVRDLNALDEIRIQTWNSEYRFRVIDPSLCKGLLTGGLLGEQQHEAVLSGCTLTESLHPHLSSRLEVGDRALFYIALRERVKCLTTSMIVELSLNKANNDPTDIHEFK